MSGPEAAPRAPGSLSASGVPRAGGSQGAAPDEIGAAAEPRRTDPRTMLIGVLSSVQNAILPAGAILFSTGGLGFVMAALIGGAIVAFGALFSYLGWTRFTYTIGREDIRVESGILSRSARSVPFERIQDVSLEQKLLPRLFGLVAVKFETGSGGGEDLSLTFLKEEDGEAMRRLVRERRDDGGAAIAAGETDIAAGDAQAGEFAAENETEGETLFAMGPARLFTFGLFEFSLAVFAVIAGLFQYADGFFDFEVWEIDVWRDLAEERAGWLFALGAAAQALGVLAAFFLVLAIGSLTGMVRVFLREWGFVLERTARGFRRRRGLFTRTDVVMPVHRVQAVGVATRALRYRFGWHGLRFISLAQDAGSTSHVVAPFARLSEIAPIIEAAGFRMPPEDADWHRATRAYRNFGILWEVIFYLILAGIAWGATSAFAPDWSGLAVGIVGAIGLLNAVASWFSWRFKRHALDADQIVSMGGVLAPATTIATRVKLHSIEISQGPIAQRLGYATLHLGLAGGSFAIPGIAHERARAVRAKVLETIAGTDFSELESQHARRAEAA